MTPSDINTAAEAIKSIGPADVHRQALGRTFIGSLLGQTVALFGLLLTYLMAVVLLYKYAVDELKSFQNDVGTVWFSILVGLPLIFILLFSFLPTWWKAARQRQLKAATIGGDAQFRAGYFRLFPYGESDREVFTRLDGANQRVFKWLFSTKSSLLYLSGASGAGKSSILAADVLPRLREHGWAIIETRLVGDPMQQLKTAILATSDLFGRKPKPELSLLHLLRRVADIHRRRGKGARLLLVVDQFEEFLILHQPSERVAFAELLHRLSEEPVDGLTLLLVFRSDYRSLVFKLSLPPTHAEVNWEEVAPYGRGEANTFMLGGGRELTPESLESLFKGLDRIEETRGLSVRLRLIWSGLFLNEWAAL